MCCILLCTHYPTTITPYSYNAHIRFCLLSPVISPSVHAWLGIISHMVHSLLYPGTDTHTSDTSTHIPTQMDMCEGTLGIPSLTDDVPYSGPHFRSYCHPFHYTNHIYWMRSQVIIGSFFHYLGINIQTWVLDLSS